MLEDRPQLQFTAILGKIILFKAGGQDDEAYQICIH